jgi:hypothetical protein
VRGPERIEVFSMYKTCDDLKICMFNAFYVMHDIPMIRVQTTYRRSTYHRRLDGQKVVTTKASEQTRYCRLVRVSSDNFDELEIQVDVGERDAGEFSVEKHHHDSL